MLQVLFSNITGLGERHKLSLNVMKEKMPHLLIEKVAFYFICNHSLWKLFVAKFILHLFEDAWRPHNFYILLFVRGDGKSNSTGYYYNIVQFTLFLQILLHKNISNDTDLSECLRFPSVVSVQCSNLNYTVHLLHLSICECNVLCFPQKEWNWDLLTSH